MESTRVCLMLTVFSRLCLRVQPCDSGGNGGQERSSPSYSRGFKVEGGCDHFYKVHHDMFLSVSEQPHIILSMLCVFSLCFVLLCYVKHCELFGRTADRLMLISYHLTKISISHCICGIKNEPFCFFLCVCAVLWPGPCSHRF